jgi:hypothetical protein
MSTSATPVSSVSTPNGFEKFFEKVGHDIKVVFTAGEKLVADLPKFIQGAEDVGGDVKQIVPLVQAVLTASLAFAKPAIAIGAAIGTAGINLAADEAAFTSVISEAETLQSQIVTFVAAVKALATAIGADWTHLLADLEAPAS